MPLWKNVWNCVRIDGDATSANSRTLKIPPMMTIGTHWNSLTAMKVPGRKRSVTMVMMCMDAVSCSVLNAIRSIRWLDTRALSAKSLLIWTLRNCNIPSNCHLYVNQCLLGGFSPQNSPELCPLVDFSPSFLAALAEHQDSAQCSSLYA